MEANHVYIPREYFAKISELKKKLAKGSAYIVYNTI